MHDTIYTTYCRAEQYTLTHIPTGRMVVAGPRFQPLIELCQQLSHLVSNFDKKPPEFDRSQGTDLTPTPRTKRDAERCQRLRWLSYQLSEQELSAVLDWLMYSVPDAKFIDHVTEIVYRWRSENITNS